MSDAAAAHALRAAPFGAGAVARARALLRGLPSVPRSRRALAVALDSLAAGLDESARGGPLRMSGDPFAALGAVAPEVCSLKALGELLGGVGSRRGLPRHISRSQVNRLLKVIPNGAPSTRVEEDSIKGSLS